MLIIVCYDVTTTTAAGRRRLRRAAKVCERHGQRVQQSVFECRLNDLQFENLEHALLEVIDQEHDCLRFYQLTEPVNLHVREYGKFEATDFTDPLVV